MLSGRKPANLRARNRPGISGIIAALILFVMLFTVGTGYFLWVSTNDQIYSQALVGRNNLNQAQQSENVLLTPSVPGPDLAIVARDTGGNPITIASIIVTDLSGNVKAVCSSSSCMLGINPGQATPQIDTSYHYVQGVSVVIKVLTQRGNVFSTTYYSPIISTTLSQASVAAGGSVYDTAKLNGASGAASGTVTYYFSSSNNCPTSGAAAVGQPVSVVNGNVPNSASQFFSTPGTYYWYAVYSGDTNDATTVSTCEPLQVTSATGASIATQLSQLVVNTGQPVYDTATLSGATSNAGGSVTYRYFSGGSCSGSPTPDGTVTVTNGIVPNSTPVPLVAAGTYSWQASYTGDANNNPATSPCEPLTVVAGGGGGSTGSLTQVIGSFKFYFTNCNPPNGGSCGTNGGGGLGDGVSARGYYGYGLSFFGGNDCDEGGSACGADVFQITLTNQDPQGRAITLSPQSFLFLQGVCLTQDLCTGEGDSGAAFAQGYWIVDGICSPASTCTGNGAVPTPYSNAVTVGSGATVTLYFYCSGPCTTSGSMLAPGTNPAPGTYLSASLNLYGLYNDGTPFGQDIPFISSYVSPVQIVGCAAGSSFPGPSCWASFNPAPQLTGNPGGQITLQVNGFAAQTSNPFPVYVYWINPSGTTTIVNAATTCDVNNQPCNVAFTIPAGAATGYYGLYVTSDGVNNAYATVSVLGTTGITTGLSQTTITVGGSVHDSATLSGVTGNAGGQVTYEYFAGSSCQGAATTVGSPVTVTNGVVPNSSPQTFNSAGPFSWNAVYSGDGSNNGATSACEPLTVNKASPSISTSLSSASVPAGQPVTDGATLTGATTTAGGTVQYVYFASNPCSGSGTNDGSPVTVTNGVVPNSPSHQFSSPGPYGWEAVYGGDPSNNAVTSACEPLTVTAAPTLSVSPFQGPSGTKITLSGSGYSNSFLYNICLSSSSSNPSCAAGSTSTFTSSAAGAIPAGTTITVPSGTSAGPYFVIVYTSGSVVQSAAFTVTLATLTLSSTQGPIGTPVTLSGSGYAPNTLYAFCFSAGSVACPGGTATTFTTTGAGAIPAGVTIPVPASGNSFVDINQGNTGTNFIISAAFTATTPTITLNPTSGPVGTVVTVTGSGFSINTPIGTFTFNGATPPTQTCTAQTTSATGTFSCTFTVPSSSNGAKTVTASGNNLGSVPADTASASFTVGKNPVTLIQTVTLCTNPGFATCSGTLTVTSGDVMVVAVSTERTSTTCITVSSITGQRGDTSYVVAPGGSVSAANAGTPNCAYSAIYYATLTSSGSDHITVTLSGTPGSGIVVVYELSSALTPPTAAIGSCTNGACSLNLATSSLPYAANSFLVTTASDCTSPSGGTRNINGGPGGFIPDYGTGNPQYVGHQLAGSSGSTTVPMTSSSGGSGPPVCWSIVGATFPDPPLTTGPTTIGLGGLQVLPLLVTCMLGAVYHRADSLVQKASTGSAFRTTRREET